MRPSVLIAGSVAQRPGVGGHTWVFLQYLLGLRRLGFDVTFVDHLDPALCVAASGQPTNDVDNSENIAYLRRAFTEFGLDDNWCVLVGDGQRTVGISRAELLRRAERCRFLLNVMGYLHDPELLAAVPQRVFLDIDPGFGQMWQALKLSDIFAGHDQFVTIGENIGQPDCLVPTCGRTWITTPQPVVLAHWPVVATADRAFSSVMSWRGIFGPIEYQGRTFGLRVHEFRKFIELPRRSDCRFHVALDIHPNETRDLQLLRDKQWQLDDPLAAAADPAAYQRYVQNSAAEFMVAKNLYVDTRGGWFSDRSLCYLASGKPVLAQDTGLRERYPSDCGLVWFTTLDEAVAGAQDIMARYEQHAAAARQVAERWFDSDRVLGRLLERLSVGG